MLRESDLLGRYGGEEFIALLPETDEEGALQVAERIRATIESEKLPLNDDRVLQVTISIGVASFRKDAPPEVESLDRLIERTDQALYQAKRSGRNRVVFVGQMGQEGSSV